MLNFFQSIEEVFPVLPNCILETENRSAFLYLQIISSLFYITISYLTFVVLLLLWQSISKINNKMSPKNMTEFLLFLSRKFLIYIHSFTDTEVKFSKI